MNPLLLVGGGGHCSSCVDVIQAQGEYFPAGIIDKKATKKINDQGIPFVGTDKDLFSLLPEFNSALITIGQIKTPNIRKNLFEQLKNNGMNFPVILSPSALISKYAKIKIAPFGFVQYSEPSPRNFVKKHKGYCIFQEKPYF